MACENPGSGEVTTTPPPSAPEPEKTPAEGQWGCIIKPAAMDPQLLFEPSEMARWGWDPANPGPKLSALNIRDWNGSDSEIEVREVDIWWPVVNKNAGYQGMWGPAVQEDPYEYRSGMPFPGFEKAFLVGLGLNFLSP
jgi:hypothetical protein